MAGRSRTRGRFERIEEICAKIRAAVYHDDESEWFGAEVEVWPEYQLGH